MIISDLLLEMICNMNDFTDKNYLFDLKYAFKS